MSNNKIEIYQKNTAGIICEVSTSLDLTGYDTYLEVKKDKDSELTFAVTGSLNLISGSYTGSYTITSTQNDITAGPYFYEIVVESGSNYYTVRQDRYIVKDSIKY